MVHLIGSLKLSVCLLGILFATVFAGTLGQAAWGASAVQTTLFSKVFFQVGSFWIPGLPFLLALTGINLAAGAWTHLERSVRHLGLWGVHLTLVLFCFGSLGFSFAQDDLVLGLTSGASADRAFLRNTADGRETIHLPFTVTLLSFRVETYPGSQEPSDYVSLVRIGTKGNEKTGEVRMNHPLRDAGWTVYQSSVQTVDGNPEPVFKLTHNPWAPFPYIISLFLGISIGVHLLVGRRKGQKHV